VKFQKKLIPLLVKLLFRLFIAFLLLYYLALIIVSNNIISKYKMKFESSFCKRPNRTYPMPVVRDKRFRTLIFTDNWENCFIMPDAETVGLSR